VASIFVKTVTIYKTLTIVAASALKYTAEFFLSRGKMHKKEYFLSAKIYGQNHNILRFGIDKSTRYSYNRYHHTK